MENICSVSCKYMLTTSIYIRYYLKIPVSPFKKNISRKYFVHPFPTNATLTRSNRNQLPTHNSRNRTLFCAARPVTTLWWCQESKTVTTDRKPWQMHYIFKGDPHTPWQVMLASIALIWNGITEIPCKGGYNLIDLPRIHWHNKDIYDTVFSIIYAWPTKSALI